MEELVENESGKRVAASLIMSKNLRARARFFHQTSETLNRKR